MLRRLFRLIVGVSAGVALASYASSTRGRAALRRAADSLREVGLAWRPTLTAGSRSGTTDNEARLEEKIEESRRRVREQTQRVHEAAGPEADSA
jgi:hypothetical protein